MSYFPMFIELKDQCCLVVGGGMVAFRKVKVLREFGAKVLVIAPEIMPEIQVQTEIICKEREMELSDLNGQKLVVAATNNKSLNHEIAKICRAKNIPVNAVDQIEDCSFIFPAYLKQGEVVAAFSSEGNSPVITQYLKGASRSLVTRQLGDLADCLGGLREEVKRCIPTEAERKQVYLKLLEIGLTQKELPSKEQIQQLIANPPLPKR